MRSLRDVSPRCDVGEVRNNTVSDLGQDRRFGIERWTPPATASRVTPSQVLFLH
ncbi:MAG: hypothetical protein NTY19_42405 [Planctomycetota bacterium]|nr:hypothetical protein [Planctomycetota bacterium]